MNELATSQTNQSLTTPGRMADMGGISQEDLQIPSIQLVQKTSALVDDGKAAFGDLYDSMENRVIGGEKQAIEFIPLSVTKCWRIFDKSGPKPKYLRTVAFGPDNAHWRFEAEENGVPIKNALVMDWNILLVDQVKGGDAIPYRISFKGSSIQSSKKLSTLIAKGSFLGVDIFGKTYVLKTVKQTNEHGTFAVLDVGPGRVADGQEVEMAKKWISVISVKPVVINEDAEPQF